MALVTAAFQSNKADKAQRCIWNEDLLGDTMHLANMVRRKHAPPQLKQVLMVALILMILSAATFIALYLQPPKEGGEQEEGEKRQVRCYAYHVTPFYRLPETTITFTKVGGTSAPIEVVTDNDGEAYVELEVGAEYDIEVHWGPFPGSFPLDYAVGSAKLRYDNESAFATSINADRRSVENIGFLENYLQAWENTILVHAYVNLDPPPEDQSDDYELIEGVPTEVGVYRHYFTLFGWYSLMEYEKVDSIPLENIGGPTLYGSKVIDKIQGSFYIISGSWIWENDLRIGFPALDNGGGYVDRLEQEMVEENVTLYYWRYVGLLPP